MWAQRQDAPCTPRRVVHPASGAPWSADLWPGSGLANQYRATHRNFLPARRPRRGVESCIYSSATMDALRSSLIALVVVLGACDVGEVPAGGPGPGPDAGMITEGSEAVFNSAIKPLVTTKGCVSCHAAAQAPNFTSYQTLDPR